MIRKKTWSPRFGEGEWGGGGGRGGGGERGLFFLYIYIENFKNLLVRNH